MPDRWEKIKHLYEFAVGVLPNERKGYVEQASLLQAENEAVDLPRQTAAKPASSLRDGDMVADRYRVIRLLGRGGMGEVYEVEDESLQERVALKTVCAERASRKDFIRRFKREIQLARKVTHPNVCRVFDVGEAKPKSPGMEAVHFFTMELLRGETLWARIQRLKTLTKEQAFVIAVQMADGLRAAHEAGVVHTDFKSGNVILCTAPAGERAVITDFGLAHFDPDTVTADNIETVSAALQFAGTPDYMSPEQMTGGTVTAASDIFSFGVVLYEMASGKLPFDRRNPSLGAVQRMAERYPAIPHLDQRWSGAISRCLRAEPAKRIQTAAELGNIFRGRSWFPPVQLWTRRNWLTASAGGVTVAGVGGGAWNRLTRPYEPKPEALEWYGKGVEALHSMTFDAARKLLEKAVQADPKFALAHGGLARAYDEMDYTDRAREQMLRAVTASQDARLSSRDSQRLRALQFTLARDYDRAVPILRELEDDAIGKKKAAAAVEAGWLAQQREDTAAASAAYQRAIQIDPRYAAAKLRMGFILQRRGGKDDEAMKAFAEAESLYTASSDVEGVIEALYQRANLLNRRTRAAEALPLIEKGLAMSRAVGNRYQEIRLQLLEGVAVRVHGDAGRAVELGQKAVDAAVAENMVNLATSGLNALGLAFVSRNDLKAAEPLFLRMLDIAERGRIRRFAALARLSLGSLCEQDNRPKEAKLHVEAAIPFHRQAGYRRELVQDTIVLGGALDLLAQYGDGVNALMEVLPLAVELGDKRVEAQLRERLGNNLRHRGDWPKALGEYQQAADRHGATLRGGYVRVKVAALHWRLGRKAEAERGLGEVEKLVKKSSVEERLLAVLTAQRAEMALGDGRLLEAVSLCREGLRLKGRGNQEERDMQMIQALAAIKGGVEAAAGLIEKLERRELIGDAAVARLTAAEAILNGGNGEAALRFAKDALIFFDARQIWESVFRCNLIVSRVSRDSVEREAHALSARNALGQLRSLWPANDLDGYFRTNEIRRLTEGVEL